VRSEPLVPADILAAIQAPFLSADAVQVDVSIIQPLGLLLDLAGEALRSRLFVVQAEGGTEACLRPDFTVPVVGHYLAKGAEAQAYVYEGKAFRAAPDEPDEPEEFRQIGMERFDAPGSDRIAADCEITRVAWTSALAGGRDDLSLWLGDVGLFSAFVDSLDLTETMAVRLKRAAARPRLLQAELGRAGSMVTDTGRSGLADLLSGLGQADAARMLEEVWALAGVEPVGGRGAAEIAQRLIRRTEADRAPALNPDQAERIRQFLAIEDEPGAALAAVAAVAGPRPDAVSASLKAWARRLEALHNAGVPIAEARFATALGHAFDYYDGLTFEIRSSEVGQDRPIAVGGRYDGLPARMGGSDQSQAIGCMVRPWRAFAGADA
jgi:ATP phosphoribosyltransferase regulatory subunit